MTSPPQEHEELVYAAAILILSQDLYPRKLEIVREYIQNASDAIDAFGSVAEIVKDDSESVIKVSVQGRSLLIFDNGIGMDGEEVQKLRRIAYSEKKVGEEAGYKGIGRLAGIAVADKLKISSTSFGDTELHHFEFRAKDMRERLAKTRNGVYRNPQPLSSIVTRNYGRLRSNGRTTTRLLNFAASLNPIRNFSTGLSRNIWGISLPVDFSPEFAWGERISQRLARTCRIILRKPFIFPRRMVTV